MYVVVTPAVNKVDMMLLYPADWIELASITISLFPISKSLLKFGLKFPAAFMAFERWIPWRYSDMNKNRAPKTPEKSVEVRAPRTNEGTSNKRIVK